MISLKPKLLVKTKQENHVRNSIFLSLFQNIIQNLYPGILFASCTDVWKFHQIYGNIYSRRLFCCLYEQVLDLINLRKIERKWIYSLVADTSDGTPPAFFHFFFFQKEIVFFRSIAFICCKNSFYQRESSYKNLFPYFHRKEYNFSYCRNWNFWIRVIFS